MVLLECLRLLLPTSLAGSSQEQSSTTLFSDITNAGGRNITMYYPPHWMLAQHSWQSCCFSHCRTRNENSSGGALPLTTAPWPHAQLRQVLKLKAVRFSEVRPNAMKRRHEILSLQRKVGNGVAMEVEEDIL